MVKKTPDHVDTSTSSNWNLWFGAPCCFHRPTPAPSLQSDTPLTASTAPSPALTSCPDCEPPLLRRRRHCCHLSALFFFFISAAPVVALRVTTLPSSLLTMV